jgi:hypothetical protein
MEGTVGEMRYEGLLEKDLKKCHLKGDRSFGRSPKSWNILFVVWVKVQSRHKTGKNDNGD